jgi:hypothetical protein
MPHAMRRKTDNVAVLPELQKLDAILDLCEQLDDPGRAYLLKRLRLKWDRRGTAPVGRPKGVKK